MRRHRHVFLNDRILPAAEAVIPVEDPGFLMGDGVFETCGAFGGTPFLFDRHLERLQHGLRTVGIEAPASLSSMPDVLRRVVEANGLQDAIARVRITVSRGVDEVPNLLVTAIGWEPPAGLRSGVALDFLTEPVVATPWKQVKSTSRQLSVLAARQRGEEYYDSLQCNTAGVLTEGTYSNLFCVRDGALHTPPVADGCLEGVTRGAILEVATRLQLPVTEASWRPDDLAQAQEVFLTSSLSGVVPVQRLRYPDVVPDAWQSQRAGGDRCEWSSPGPTTVRVRDAYVSWLEEATCHKS